MSIHATHLGRPSTVMSPNPVGVVAFEAKPNFENAAKKPRPLGLL